MSLPYKLEYDVLRKKILKLDKHCPEELIEKFIVALDKTNVAMNEIFYEDLK